MQTLLFPPAFSPLPAADQPLTDYQRVARAIRFLEANFRQQPSLDDVAAAVHLSPFHFQRLFSEWAGISPKRFVQYLTADFLKQRLAQTGSLTEAAEAAGLSAPSRLHDLFVTLEAVTPHEFRTGGAGVRIAYGLHDTPFGPALLSATERGICGLALLAPEQPDTSLALADLRKAWPEAHIEEDTARTAPLLSRAFAPSAGQPLHLLVRGTNFQVKVWEALLRIGEGQLVSYQHIAQAIGQPKALQAVGSAVGANPVAYLIPCHRVIRKEGVLGEYRWGTTTKKALIGWEMAQAERQAGQFA
ncbi:methylated-DNA--[protein]-cysteine S-methyltransferase [Hymenobacter busanensis]|uniref:methylated-DNA--[protein]-cysteine S-methyltransferase n=1 Tax=Hymenobacter busanensis TaxID=2607656 RepID=A0A7L4ZXR0_9BACT|nr:methylated-DNA--[protein]-cysteine S-methyltransferase [Hymenobacter busanensis]KAA9325931.1 methylated-DNA--[protein]-cysteine S-methyltransferase [Hymenobacter busanensis]QHJ06230.1 methylated-DNA--[protein]-cysteine S-methyltransferase [Hymenobacter busanensis]